MNRTLVIGDIHGNYKGLIQALERSNFDYEKDTLISLGDVVDGHSQSYEVVEELLKIKNLIAVKGNHDDWFNSFLETGKHGSGWMQGAKATGMSYLNKSRPNTTWWTPIIDMPGMIESIRTNDIPDRHIEFFNNQIYYYKDNQNRLFIHGGFNRHEKLENHESFIFWWDRDLWSQALSYESMSKVDLPGHVPGWKPKFKMVENFSEVFIGHTSTQFWGSNVPMKAANIWNLDTGGGWHGYITIMDIDTKEYWQSDSGKELYPEFKGR